MRNLCVYALLCAALMSCNCNSKCDQNKCCQGAEGKNAVVEAIMSRRSIREYKPEQIKPEELQTILECGINAPSAMNRQPWAVRAIQRKSLLDSMCTAFVEHIKQHADERMLKRISDPSYHPLFGAPTFIIVAADTANKYALNDCGMLIQNIQLAAESMDIGTCTIGSFMDYLRSPEGERFRQQLNFPEGYAIDLGITMGYKAQRPEAKPRDKAKAQVIE